MPSLTGLTASERSIRNTADGVPCVQVVGSIVPPPSSGSLPRGELILEPSGGFVRWSWLPLSWASIVAKPAQDNVELQTTQYMALVSLDDWRLWALPVPGVQAVGSIVPPPSPGSLRPETPETPKTPETPDSRSWTCGESPRDLEDLGHRPLRHLLGHRPEGLRPLLQAALLRRPPSTPREALARARGPSAP